MLAALCVALGLLCPPRDLPYPEHAPSAAPAAVVLSSVDMGKPVVPKASAATFFDPECEVQPPDNLKNHYAFAARRYPGGGTDCQLAKQGKAECDECWATGDYSIESPAGAIGVAQFLPPTAAELGVNPHDPRQSIFGQARYVEWSRERWTPPDFCDRTAEDIEDLGLITYNWGLGSARADQERNGWCRSAEARPHLPLETRNYLIRITGR